MSGRRFRILSDSEDESPERTDSAEQREVTETSATAAQKKRTRIVSDSSDEHEADVNEREENDSSLEQDADPPVRAQRQSSPENDTNRSDAAESEESDVNESGKDRRRSDGHQSNESSRDGNQSDSHIPGRVHSDNENEEGGERSPTRHADEAEEAQETSERRIVKKRVVKNPQPKLDAARLTGERGLGRLRNMHPTIRLKGKGHEHEDLKCILHNLQLWGHRMFPKMQTKDIFERCERLGAKMPVRIHLRRMRTGEIHDFVKPIDGSDDEVARVVDEDDEARQDHGPHGHIPEEEEEEPSPIENTRDMFQELLEQENLPTQKPMATATTDSTGITPPDQDDLQAKIQAKKMEALRRREELKARREAQQREEELLEAQMALEMEAVESSAV